MCLAGNDGDLTRGYLRGRRLQLIVMPMGFLWGSQNPLESKELPEEVTC